MIFQELTLFRFRNRLKSRGAKIRKGLGPFCCLTVVAFAGQWIRRAVVMRRQIQIRAIRRKEIDIEKLAHALLKMARDRQKAQTAKAKKPTEPEVRDE